VPNERWSLDFVSDSFTDGRRFRILAIVDDCTRECLALVAVT
jgi:putative transposase